MKGFDFFMACYRKGVDLPVRIFAETKAPANFYRPESVCFINLEADDEVGGDYLALLSGFDVSIIADEATDYVRRLTKRILAEKPRHLVVLAGDTFASWALHRGWK
jgi:hypothetical protein